MGERETGVRATRLTVNFPHLEYFEQLSEIKCIPVYERTYTTKQLISSCHGINCKTLTCDDFMEGRSLYSFFR